MLGTKVPQLLQKKVGSLHQRLNINAAADRGKGPQVPYSALKQSAGAAVVAFLPVQKANTDLQNPFVQIPDVTLFLFPQLFQGFVTRKVTALVKLADTHRKGITGEGSAIGLFSLHGQGRRLIRAICSFRVQ